MIREIVQTPMPDRIAKLPRDTRGYPIPYFVPIVDGVPDFKYLDERKQKLCIRYRRCAICGEQIDGEVAFIGGPKTVENRVCSDPGMHEDCARYAIAVCPFMARPTAKRSGRYHDDSVRPPGAIDERPERTALYITRAYIPRSVRGQTLIRLYPAHRVVWFENGIEVE